MAGRLLPLGAALLTLAVAHGPGRRAGLSGGGGEYWFQGCNTPLHEASYQEAQVWIAQRPEHGLTWALEGAAARARERPLQPAENPGPTMTAWRGMGAARVGYQWTYGGVEGGIAVGRLRMGDDEGSKVLPSARVWAGLPEHVHVFASMFADETRGHSRVLGFGLGHASRFLRADIAVGGSQGNDGAAFGDLLFPVGSFWLGFGGQVRDSRTWSGVVHVEIGWE